MQNKFILIFILLVLSPTASSRATFQTQAPLYIIGEVEGALVALEAKLKKHQLIDAQSNWIGGKSHLISLGDMVSDNYAGLASNEKVLKLIQKLQQQAEIAGGKIHYLLGDYELKALGENVIGIDLTNWLSQQKFLLQVNQHLFTHAGIANRIAITNLDDYNQTLSKALKKHLAKVAAKKNNPSAKSTFSKDYFWLTTKIRNAFSVEGKNKLFNWQSPVFYTGNGNCHPFLESDLLKEQLTKLQAKTLWITDTTREHARIQTRLDKQLILIDSDDSFGADKKIMLAKIDGEQVSYFIDDDTNADEITTAIDREWQRPFDLNDAAIEAFLQSAEITEQTETLEGRTKPLKLYLQKDGQKMKALFKFIAKYNRRSRMKFEGAGDHYNHEMAAYKMDQLLGLGLVPMTAEREIDGKKGTVQLWIDNMASALQLNEGQVRYQGYCNVEAQENLMNVFDYLIYNFDRNQTNIVFTQHDWQIWFIDHTRSFGTPLKQPPFQRGITLTLSDPFRKALQRLTYEQLNQLAPWLRQEQIEAIWGRRERLLNNDI